MIHISFDHGGLIRPDIIDHMCHTLCSDGMLTS